MPGQGQPVLSGQRVPGSLNDQPLINTAHLFHWQGPISFQPPFDQSDQRGYHMVCRQFSRERQLTQLPCVTLNVIFDPPGE